MIVLPAAMGVGRDNESLIGRVGANLGTSSPHRMGMLAGVDVRVFLRTMIRMRMPVRIVSVAM